MTLTEKVSYIKGLADGLALDEAKPEAKVIKAMLEVLDDMALTISDLEDNLDLVSEQVDAVDEDLDELEEFIYGDFEDDDCCDCDCCDYDDEDGEYYDVQCPTCGETICIDESILEEGSINCPKCNELLTFDIEEEDADED